MPQSRLGKVLLAVGTPLFVIALALDALLRNAHPWVDPLAEAVVAVAVALLVGAWLSERFPRRRSRA